MATRDPLARIGTRVPTATPQGQRSFGRSDEVKNNAGGYVFQVDDWARLRRFLVLGTEGGTFYVSEPKLTQDNAQVVQRCIAADGPRLVAELVKVSTENLAPRVQPTIFALAMASGQGDDKTRAAALDALPVICRTGYHLHKFIGYAENFRGWGRGLRRAVSDWYLRRDADSLAYQIIKYAQREGWSNRDLLRLSHPVAGNSVVNDIFRYIVGKDVESFEALPRVIHGVEKVRQATSAKQVAAIVTEYGLPREAIPSDYLSKVEVWEALIPGMPMTALVRNLGTMTSNGALKSFGAMEKIVLDKLGNKDAILKARVHPFAILLALTTYKAGRGVRGTNTWTPVTSVLDALDEAFYLAFDNVTPSGKNTMVSLDISGSMTWGALLNTHITPREASAAMALITLNAEPRTMVTVFDTGIRVVNDVTPKMRIDRVIRATDGWGGGATDCAQPMIFAQKNKLDVDTFVIYTDNETWAGHTKPFEALRNYRLASGNAAKEIVVGMTSTGFSIADPTDPGMLDVVGFDASAPQVISDFAADRV